MFLDLFYGLRDEGVPVAIQEWQTFLRALEEGLHGSQPAALLPPRARLPDQERDLLRRLRPRLRARLQGRRGAVRRRRHRAGAGVAAATRRTSRSCRRRSWRRSSSSSSDELMRRFLETLQEQTERHDGGDHWVGTGGKSPFGHGGQHPTGIRVGGQSQEPLGDEGRRGAPLQGLPHRRHARRAPGEGGAAPPAPADAHRPGRPSSISTRPSTRPAATPARSSWSSARRGATTSACCC